MKHEITGIEEKAVELIEKFEALATDIAPDAVELGLVTARVAAIEEAMFLIGALIGAAILIPLATRLAREVDWDSPSFPPLVIPFSGATIGAFFCTIAALKWASVWPFVGIFYPELWIAKQVLGW